LRTGPAILKAVVGEGWHWANRQAVLVWSVLLAYTTYSGCCGAPGCQFIEGIRRSRQSSESRRSNRT
jgi:hypothetical protein